MGTSTDGYLLALVDPQMISNSISSSIKSAISAWCQKVSELDFFLDRIDRKKVKDRLLYIRRKG